jgi:hypothetical protein
LEGMASQQVKPLKAWEGIRREGSFRDQPGCPWRTFSDMFSLQNQGQMSWQAVRCHGAEGHPNMLFVFEE